jgi:DNA-binding transcriptional MerR regulator/effector-binding domain-containing protein
MFAIGEFSKITGLTVKTLRFYHEQGLLAPSCVDDQTGYRYYDGSKAETARVITALRGLDLSLDEIRAVLREVADDADLREILQRQKAAIDRKIRHYQEVGRSLERLLTQDEEAKRIMASASFQIEEKTVAPVLIAGIRKKGRYSDCGEAFARLGRRFGRFINGKPLLLHFDSEYHENDANFEACMPVRGGKSEDGIDVRELSGARCVTLLHKGPYDQLGRSYAKLLQYIREEGHDVVLPTREIYHKGPGMIFRGNPKNYLTEIQLPIKNAKVGTNAD